MGYPSKSRSPARTFSWGEAVAVKATAAITTNQIIAVTGSAGGHRTVEPADGSKHGKYRLLIAKHDIPVGEYGIALPYLSLSSTNTATFSVGDILWLHPTTPGSYAAVGASVDARVVGSVTVSDIAVGEIELFGGMPSAAAGVEASGSSATARILMASQPTAGDTLTIGADVYEFDGAGVNINVAIGGSATVTRASLITAINGSGTEKVFADEVATAVRIRAADAAGGNVVGKSPNIVLAESITAAADVWDVGNVNMNTLGGGLSGPGQVGHTALTVTAAMITSGARVDFPFTPSHIVAQVWTSANVLRAYGTDSFAIGNDGVAITFGGGGSPDIQATDIVRIVAYS